MSFAEYFNATSGLFDAYEQGQKKAALAKLGARIGAGDYSGAAAAALDAGELGPGVALLKLGQAERKDARQLANSAAVFGPGGLSGLYGGDGADLGALGQGAAAAAAQPKPLAALGAGAPTFTSNEGAVGDYLASTRARESSGNDLAANPNSTALGRYQFTRGTWGNLARQHPDLGLTPDGRTDAAQQERAMAAFTNDNARSLTDAGITINPASLYGSHLLGSGGFKRLYFGGSRQPDAPAAGFADPAAVRANRAVFYRSDGSPKTVSEVLQWMGSGGGSRVASGAQPSPSVDVAEDEAGAWALEQRMGMLPRQVASADPEADMPAMGMVPASLPGGSRFPSGAGPHSSASGRLPPSSDNNARNAPPGFPPSVNSNGQLRPQPVPPLDVPTLGGPAPAGRTMTMPGADGAPVQVAQAGTGAPQVASDAESAAFQRRIGGLSANQRVQILLRASAMDLPEHQQGLVKQLLGDALQEARMPDTVREFLWARANGYTKAATPGAYAAEKAGPKVLSAGSSIVTPDGRILVTAPGKAERDDGDKIREQIASRREAAPSLGLEEGSPAWRSFVATGKVGADRDMSPTEKKMIETADAQSIASQTVIGQLEQAKTLSAQAYAGPLASTRGTLTGTFGSEAGQATTELDNVVTGSALAQLKTIFGGNPTEGERKILLDVQGSSNLPHALRIKVYDRAIDLARLKMEQSQAKADAIREGRYFRQGGGASVRDAGAAGTSGSPALPAPSPSNRPGASSAADRFGQLVGSGLSKQQAYEQMHREGY